MSAGSSMKRALKVAVCEDHGIACPRAEAKADRTFHNKVAKAHKRGSHEMVPHKWAEHCPPCMLVMEMAARRANLRFDVLKDEETERKRRESKLTARASRLLARLRRVAQ